MASSSLSRFSCATSASSWSVYCWRFWRLRCADWRLRILRATLGSLGSSSSPPSSAGVENLSFRFRMRSARLARHCSEYFRLLASSVPGRGRGSMNSGWSSSSSFEFPWSAHCGWASMELVRANAEARLSAPSASGSARRVIPLICWLEREFTLSPVLGGGVGASSEAPVPCAVELNRCRSLYKLSSCVLRWLTTALEEGARGGLLFAAGLFSMLHMSSILSLGGCDVEGCVWGGCVAKGVDARCKGGLGTGRS
mmetsp:Transcript_9982/g.28665  ORF Transcript_9982/g.28665 Transcript_9982/m.28665 type:complete len:254 (-) Transcript_9982:434-1195(-)